MGSFLDHYLAPLAGLIEDAASIEIALNADARVWIERAGDPYERDPHSGSDTRMGA